MFSKLNLSLSLLYLSQTRSLEPSLTLPLNLASVLQQSPVFEHFSNLPSLFLSYCYFPGLITSDVHKAIVSQLSVLSSSYPITHISISVLIYQPKFFIPLSMPLAMTFKFPPLKMEYTSPPLHFGLTHVGYFNQVNI